MIELKKVLTTCDNSIEIDEYTKYIINPSSPIKVILENGEKTTAFLTKILYRKSLTDKWHQQDEDEYITINALVSAEYINVDSQKGKFIKLVSDINNKRNNKTIDLTINPFISLMGDLEGPQTLTLHETEETQAENEENT